jgi:hypothetical protein
MNGKRLLFSFLVFATASLMYSCSGSGSSDTVGQTGTPIIADHTIVADYSKIPQTYINEVKKMWINVPGESHSEAYRAGLTLLAASDSRFAATVTESGNPEAYTDQHLRTNRGVRTGSWSYGTGETVFWTYTPTGSENIIKNHITYCETNNLHISAIGFGWCWDLTRSTASPSADTVYGCHWYGSSNSSTDTGWWGLDDVDSTINCNTYCKRVDEYSAFCKSSGYTTKVFFTTGPADVTGESGYQAFLKHEYIRNYVKADSSGILFDYADILCFDDNGQQNMTTWNGHAFPILTTANSGDNSIGHIGSVGAIRLAKAEWWMLARIAGWDGK